MVDTQLQAPPPTSTPRNRCTATNQLPETPHQLARVPKHTRERATTAVAGAQHRGHATIACENPMAPTSSVNIATATLSVLLFVQSAIAADEFEWGGTFDVPETDYAWTMQIVDGEWADPSMKLAILPTTGTAESHLEAVEGLSLIHI